MIFFGPIILGNVKLLILSYFDQPKRFTNFSVFEKIAGSLDLSLLFDCVYTIFYLRHMHFEKQFEKARDKKRNRAQSL